jgi:phosphotransferase system enzyme I (PtsP)
MIETPAALAIIDTLARESDFLSVGTNDFIQYMLAVDRTNYNVGKLYTAHHPSVLHGLERIAAAAAKRGAPLSICGEMGRDPRHIPFLLGIGFRTLSLEPAQIPAAQRLISRLSISACATHASRLLTLDHIADIEKEIDAFAAKP